MPTATFAPLPLVAGLPEALTEKAVAFESLEDACRNCAHDDSDDISFPKGFSVDTSSDMLGSGNTSLRIAVISTGKSDWIHSVGDDKATLAGQLESAAASGGGGGGGKGPKGPKEGKGGGGGLLGKLGKKVFGGADGALEDDGSIKGVIASSAQRTQEQINAAAEAGVSGKLTILNSSFQSSSSDHEHQSVLVFPDFKVIHEVPQTAEGAKALHSHYLTAGVGRTGLTGPAESTLRSWPLPYHAVILLCSHKKRDARCSQAAPILTAQFQHHLESHGLEVDTRGEDLEEGAPIEEWDESTREARLEESLRGVKTNGGRVGIFNVSHIGGHKFSGVMQVYLPNGVAISYGRVRPSDVGAIVETTILGGKIIPELLRGAQGIEGKAQSVLSW